MKNISIFEKRIHPLKQALAILGFSIFLQFGYYLIKDNEAGSGFYWEVTFAMLLFYALCNTALSFTYSNRTFYWTFSIIGFVLLVGVNIGLAFLLSDRSFESAGAFQWLIFLFTFVYLVLIAIVNAVRKIILIAQKQDARLRGEE